MNVNLPDAELMVAMSAPNPPADPPATHSTASTAPSRDPPTARHDGPAGGAVSPPTEWAGEESDNTPRSEVPSVPDSVAAGLLQHVQHFSPEPSYFSPQPLRLYSSSIPRSTPNSTNPSPTTSVNASTTSVNSPDPLPASNTRPSPTSALLADRPAVQRDLSSTSTTSVTTVRANSVDPSFAYGPPSAPRDGPHYPNQSYAALHFQQYPPPHAPPILRSRTSHPGHVSGYSLSGISSFGLTADHHRDIMDTGSRTVGNSPASSPGLFSPKTPPLGTARDQVGDNSYSTPWLHHTHRQAPKETHVADVDVDPVSGRKIVNQYEVIDELGRGVHGKVKLGRDLTEGNFVAIKIVDRYSKRRRLGKNTSHEDKIKKEIAILKKARHPNIVSLLEVIDDPAKKKVYIVLEHVMMGEVKWRTAGAKEVCLIEWRRYQRESQGIFDNESATLEDEKIMRVAHKKLERQERRRAREAHLRRMQVSGNELWSFEHGGDSDDGQSEAGNASQASTRLEAKSSSRLQAGERQEYAGHHESTMETAFRSIPPPANIKQEDALLTAELDGTMYGAYDTELHRGRTPSVADSSSSHVTDGDEEVPEHFHYVPLMTISGARETFRDTVLGLEYLHYQGVIHRDIKPANLLQTEDHRIKISDFGVSYLGRPSSEDLSGDQSESDFQEADDAIELAKTVGTPAFYAPELCHTDLDVETPLIDKSIDVWALGVTLYCLIYGRVPFHDHNQFMLMRVITDTEPYFPRYRLKPVMEGSNSRPSSQGRFYHKTSSSKRAPHDLEYEEVDEHLRDLLKRLLEKDSRKRITIKEIKRHPWLLQGIDNSNSWVDDTDPDKSFQGRKIQISRDDVEKAVIPITLIDRVRSGVRKTFDIVTKNLTRGGSRKRAQSTATNPEPLPSISAHSSSSTISQEGRRGSLGPSLNFLEALGKSRESDHPLSQSVTARPEVVEPRKFFEGTQPRKASPVQSIEGHEQLTQLPSISRPHPPERAHSTMSSSSSIKTVRQPDVSTRGRAVSPNLPHVLPGTPTALDTPGGSNLGGIFGGVPRRIVNSMRSRERLLKPPREHTRAKSIDRLVNPEDDPHSGPSLAISPTVASGHVNQPDALKELSSSSNDRGTSPNPSEMQAPDNEEPYSSRQSSVSSVSSRLRKNWATQQNAPQDNNVVPVLEMPAFTSAPTAVRKTSDDRFVRAKNEFLRRRVREHNLRDRPQSAFHHRPASSFNHACPPSPDDETFYQRQKIEEYLDRQHPTSATTSSRPINISANQSRALASSSSEEQFTSMSQSTSNPSIPSVASANSSVGLEDGLGHNCQFPRMGGGTHATSADSLRLNQFDAPMDDPAGYDGDHAVDSEDDDSDEEDFIVMGKKKPVARSESISNAELARSEARKAAIGRRRSARSGSNGTVKKLRPAGESENEKTPERS